MNITHVLHFVNYDLEHILITFTLKLENIMEFLKNYNYNHFDKKKKKLGVLQFIPSRHGFNFKSDKNKTYNE